MMADFRVYDVLTPLGKCKEGLHLFANRAARLGCQSLLVVVAGIKSQSLITALERVFIFAPSFSHDSRWYQIGGNTLIYLLFDSE